MLVLLKVEVASTRRLRPEFRFDGEKEWKILERLNQLKRPVALDLIASPPEDVAALRRVVEAFPNSFLGVVLPDEDFHDAKIPRGKKFTWLYKRWLEHRLFEKFAPAVIAAACETERRSDVRAALICLLTAHTVASGMATQVGDDAGGWFYLPPRAWWANWARQAPVNCAP